MFLNIKLAGIFWDIILTGLASVYIKDENRI